MSTNNLQKHYASKHPKLILNAAEGRPTTVEETAAIGKYKVKSFTSSLLVIY